MHFYCGSQIGRSTKKAKQNPGELLNRFKVWVFKKFIYTTRESTLDLREPAHLNAINVELQIDKKKDQIKEKCTR